MLPAQGAPGPGPGGQLDGPSGGLRGRIAAPRVQSAVSGSSPGPPDLGRNQARTAPETGHGVELRAVCLGNHPRTGRERRHKAKKTRVLPSADGKAFGANAANV